MKPNIRPDLSLTDKYYSVNLILLIFILLISFRDYTSAQGDTNKTYIVSPSGSDNNPGTRSQPLASLEAARDAARLAGSGNHQIIVLAGDYYLAKPFELDARDNGLTIEADSVGKVVLYGGSLITGWQRDGEKFWYADLPGVKEGTLDFRALVVNGRMPERARIPESGTFLHLSVFDYPWLSSVAGGWARKPTQEELTTMRYDPKDIPESLDIRNAEVRVYHMWDESLVGVARNDIQNHTLVFSTPAVHPAGGFGKKDYIVWNTREGMTKPGRWYLDRTAGRLVYWPLENEDMATARIIAPGIERIIRIAGDQNKKAENITIRGLILQGTTIPLKPAGFGAFSLGGALTMVNVYKCILDGIEIANVGGVGISATQMTDCRITDCHVHNIGGGGVRASGDNLFFSRNHIHDAGVYYPSAVGLSTSGKGNHIYRNEIHDTPYSGMIIDGSGLLIEENLIYRVMREIHDGAAIYGGGFNNILRGNVVRDISEAGQGYGVSAYYFDEGAHDNIVEKNVSINVARPTHNHITRNSIIRDNVFITDEDMTLSFQSSAKLSFEGNTLITPGRLRITAPNAVISWKGNKIFSNGRGKNNVPQAYTIDSAMPFTAVPAPKTRPIVVMRSLKPPVLDGEMVTDEWTGEYQRLDREPSRMAYSGAPVLVKFSWDSKFLYIGALLTMFDNANITGGSGWGKDDGMEISIGGFIKGKPSTFIIRGYAYGTVQSVADGGVAISASEKLGKEVRFVSKKMTRRGWIGEWAIPLDAMGLKPKPDLKVAFNICAFVNEYDNWHCWEGTLGESWQVDKAGILMLK